MTRRQRFHFGGDTELFHGLLADEDVTSHNSGQPLDASGHIDGVAEEAVSRRFLNAGISRQNTPRMNSDPVSKCRLSLSYPLPVQDFQSLAHLEYRLHR